jgi:hypothetical protein
VPPNSNVWADVATVWRSLLADPVQAAHVLGKLLSRLGEDRVLWGTDSVWYGPPQTQIMAFRVFEISAEFQQRYGYPALTGAVKAKVLGLNAAGCGAWTRTPPAAPWPLTHLTVTVPYHGPWPRPASCRRPGSPADRSPAGRSCTGWHMNPDPGYPHDAAPSGLTTQAWVPGRAAGPRGRAAVLPARQRAGCSAR